MKKLFLMSLILGITACSQIEAQQKLSFIEEENMIDATSAVPSESLSISPDSTMLIGVVTSPQGIKVQVELLPGMMQHRALREGLVVYFDVSGKKKEKYSVQFPKKEFSMQGMMEQAEFDPNERPAMPNISLDIEQLASEPSTFIQDKDEKMMTLDNARLYMQGDRLVYICYVPFANLGNKIDKNGRYNIRVTTNSANSQRPPFGDSNQMGGPGGGMGGPGMGGPGGGMGGPGMGGPGGGMGGPGGRGGMRGGPGMGDRPDGNRPAKTEKIWYVLSND